MEETPIAIYIICDDLVKILNLVDNPQSVMTTAEVITLQSYPQLFQQETIRKQDGS